jgi:quercetin dioxygenase-like cupin family protein
VIHIDWSTAPREALNERLTRQVFHTGLFTIARLEIKDGAVVPVHEHENEQVTTVLSGCLRFTICGQVLEISAGQSLAIAPMEPHGIVAVGDVVALDLFSPRREDWIRGDDAYLRR